MLPTMRENIIPFVAKLKKLEAEGADSDKVESIRFEFLVDPSKLAARFSKEFFIFNDGSPWSTSGGLLVTVNWIC
jgi:hypothetical protein